MQFTYGLATSLSNVCRELDVDLVRGWNVDNPYTWGKVGHYTVAARAIEAISDNGLKSFMQDNLENITFANDHINGGLDTRNNPDLPRNPDDGLITPLADVPDIIWKQSKKTTKYGRMSAIWLLWRREELADVAAVMSRAVWMQSSNSSWLNGFAR